MTLTSPQQRLIDALPPQLHAAAMARYARHGAVLESRLARLYGHLPDFNEWQGALMASIAGLMAARPSALLDLDCARAADPDWFASNRMLGYSAYVRQFGGSLRGVMARIGHLRELGVTYLHLLPFLKPRAGENDGGFAVASFDEVDPSLGTEADLLALTAALREAGISLCSDLVLNHVADDHAWARGAAAGDATLRDYFHVYPDRRQPDLFEATVGQIFPDAAPGNFTWVEAMQGWVWTTFYPFQWDLNYANPQVLSAMVASLLGLANKGVESFRLDSTAFLWKREGTDCMNQPEAHALLQVLRAIVEIAAPGVLLKAEAIVPTRALPAYFGDGDGGECHLAYHSTLMAAGWAALAEQDTQLLRAVIAATPALPRRASWLTYVRCHDDIGWNVLRDEAQSPARLAQIAQFYNDGASFADGVAFQSGAGRAVHGTNGSAAALAGVAFDEDAGVRRVLLLHALALAFGALPVLYMGDELASENDYAYVDDPARAHDTRWVQRASFDTVRLAQRGDLSTSAGKLYQGLGALLALRRTLPALNAGAPRTLLAGGDPAVLALARGEAFVCLLNFSDREVRASLPGRIDDIVLEPWGMTWTA